jgi:hypothetical protein
MPPRTSDGPMEHDLKTWPESYDAIARGDKTCELRVDRAYAIGDILIMRRWDPQTQGYTGEVLRRRVTYIDRFSWVGPGGAIHDQCVMSISLVQP